MKNSVLTIGGIDIQPGEHKTIRLAMPELYDCTPMHMPVEVIRGKKPGPILCISAAVHGDELNGVEIIRRFRKKRVLKTLSGTIILIPIVNVYGFLYQDRYLLDRRDLNRSFPGSSQGSLAARLANLIVQEIVCNVTHFIDLHTGSNHRCNLPQIRGNLEDPITKKLAIRFGAPVALHYKELEGSLRREASLRGVHFLVYEAGEAFRFDELSIRVGLKGLLNVLSGLKMISTSKVKKVNVAVARSSYWVRSPYSGIIRSLKSLGRKVSKGETLAIVYNPTGKEEYKVLASESGIIIGKSNLPLVHEGAALFHIACFHESRQVENDIKDIQALYEDGSLDDNSELLGAE